MNKYILILVILILVIFSFGILCNADTYEYTGQNYPANVATLKSAIKADATFSGIAWQYIDYYGEDLSNCTYKVTCDATLTGDQKTALDNHISTYNVSNWASL